MHIQKLTIVAAAALLLLAACAAPPTSGAGEAAGASAPVSTAATAATPPRLYVENTPSTTTSGHTFVVPAGWSVSVRGNATVLQPPEPGSSITLVDVEASDADAALAAAWAAARPGEPVRPLKVATAAAPRDGWSARRSYSYETSPNEKRGISAFASRTAAGWNVSIYDMADDVGEKRASQAGLIFGRLLPKGYQRESFAGRPANKLDAARIAQLGDFVKNAMTQTGVPGVSVGLVQDGKVVFADGFGVRELGKPARVDGNTRYMIASNTKALATLMLARLVDQGRIGWDTPATDLLPSFKLGDAQTTASVHVRHLICACTGMPRQDLEWLLEYKDLTPERAMTTLGTMQPTSKFGELFQYSNPMAAAAGFIGGHVAYPKLELGAAYDRAMQAMVFTPLGMKDTTFNFATARRGNAAVPHSPDIDGRQALAEARINLSIVPLRPAGGAWSSVNDMLKYVSMELAEGTLPDGKRYISQAPLLERRAPQVTIGNDETYGMGLMVNRVYGTPVVHHGGDLAGFHSDMMWLPEQNVGAVILTNGDPGWLIRTNFRRKLLEVLFDGKPEADAQMAAQAQAFAADNAAERQKLTVPAAPELAADLAGRYANPALGEIVVTRPKAGLRFDFGEFSSGMASRVNADGTRSVVTTVPGFSDLEFVIGSRDGKRSLILRDAQHEYVLLEK